MAKYIDKDALVAEIENIRKHYIERDDFDNGWNFALDKVLSFLDTLEVKEVQKEPISKDFEAALAECINQAQCAVVDPMAHAEIWKEELLELAKSEEPVSDLEEAVTSFTRKDSKGISNPANFYYTVADKARIFKAGANWQLNKIRKENEKNRD